MKLKKGNTRMRLILYGTKKDRAEITQTISEIPELSYRKISIEDYQDYDSFLSGLGNGCPECIVIAMDGAEGMEGVIAARNSRRDIPILWFSDDGAFGAQSYRLGCAYFHQKPMSPEALLAVTSKCL